MARLKYDVSGVEPSGDFGELPPPGVYPASFVEIVDELPDGKSRRLKVVLALDAPKESKGYRLYEYITLKGKPGGPLLPEDTTAWKLRQFIDSLALSEKGSLDLDRADKLPSIRVNVKHEEYQGEMRGKVRSLLPALDADDDEEDEEEVDEVEEDDEEEEVDYSSMEDDELVAALEEAELDVPMVGKGRRAKLDRDAAIELLEEQEDEDEDEDEDEEDEEEEEEEVDYASWTLGDLKAEVEERSLEIKGKPLKAKLVAALEKNDEEDPLS